MINVGAFSLSSGQSVKINGRSFQCGAVQPDERLAFHAVGVDESICWDTKEIASHYLKGTLEFVDTGTTAFQKKPFALVADFASFSQAHKEVVRRKLLYVDGVNARTSKNCSQLLIQLAVTQIAEECGDQAPPSARSVVEWRRQLKRAGGDVRVLLPQLARRGNRLRRLAPEVLEIIRKHSEQHYLSIQQNTMRHVCREVEHTINRDNEFRSSEHKLETPSYKVIRRHIKSLDPFDVMASREGRRAAERAFRAYGMGPVTTRPLERVEIDHTVLDLFVLDQGLGLILGRPYLTIAMDAHTRAIVGMYIGFTPPSYVTVMEVLKRTILPKTALREKYPSIINEWDAHGMPDAIIVDNGKEFHSADLADACLQLKIQVQYCPPGEPWYKGVIERFFRTLNQRLLHSLPGTTFGKIYKLAEYDPTKHAVVDFLVLSEILYTWLADIYMQEIHRGIGTSPADKWRTSSSAFPPRWPPSRRDLDITLGLIEERVIGKRGIEYQGLFYNCDALARIRNAIPSGQRVTIKYLPDDMTRVFVRDPASGAYVEAPAIDQAYTAGKTWWLHKLVCAEASRTASGRIDRDQILKAEQRIRRRIAQSIQKPNKRGNKHLARAVEQSERPFDSAPDWRDADPPTSRPAPDAKPPEPPAEPEAETVSSAGPKHPPKPSAPQWRVDYD